MYCIRVARDGLGNLANDPVAVTPGGATSVVSVDTADNVNTSSGSSLPSYYEVGWVMRVK